jgi:hypothetical protein
MGNLPSKREDGFGTDGIGEDGDQEIGSHGHSPVGGTGTTQTGGTQGHDAGAQSGGGRVDNRPEKLTEG